VRTLNSGERYIDAGVVTTSGTGTIAPLGMTNKTLGGCSLGTVSGHLQPGVINGIGPNNIGLLVKTTGAVGTVNAAEGWFNIDDGSGVGVTVYGSVPSGSTYVVVTGISSCAGSDAGPTRVILATSIQ
jgi:hypothetical protein